MTSNNNNSPKETTDERTQWGRCRLPHKQAANGFSLWNILKKCFGRVSTDGPMGPRNLPEAAVEGAPCASLHIYNDIVKYSGCIVVVAMFFVEGRINASGGFSPHRSVRVGSRKATRLDKALAGMDSSSQPPGPHAGRCWNHGNQNNKEAKAVRIRLGCLAHVEIPRSDRAVPSCLSRSPDKAETAGDSGEQTFDGKLPGKAASGLETWTTARTLRHGCQTGSECGVERRTADMAVAFRRVESATLIRIPALFGIRRWAVSVFSTQLRPAQPLSCLEQWCSSWFSESWVDKDGSP